MSHVRRLLSTADIPVLPGHFPQLLTQWVYVDVSPSMAAVRSSLSHPSQVLSLSSSESVHRPPPLRPASPPGKPSVLPPPLVEFKSFLSGDSCHRLRSSLSPPAPFCASWPCHNLISTLLMAKHLLMTSVGLLAVDKAIQQKERRDAYFIHSLKL